MLKLSETSDTKTSSKEYCCGIITIHAYGSFKKSKCERLFFFFFFLFHWECGLTLRWRRHIWNLNKKWLFLILFFWKGLLVVQACWMYLKLHIIFWNRILIRQISNENCIRKVYFTLKTFACHSSFSFYLHLHLLFCFKL